MREMRQLVRSDTDENIEKSQVMDRLIEHYGSKEAVMVALAKNKELVERDIERKAEYQNQFFDPKFIGESVPGPPATTAQKLASFQQANPDALLGPVKPSFKDMMNTSGVPIGPQLNPAWQPLPPQLRQDGRPMPDDFSGEREAYLRSLQESTPDLGGGLLSDTVPPEESSFDLLSMIGQAPDAISDWWDSLSQEDQSVYKRERGAREPLVADPAEAAEYVAARKLSGPPRSSLSLSPQTSFPQMNEPPRFSGYGPRSGEGQFSQAFPGSDPNEDRQKQGWDNQPAGPLAETSSGEGGKWESDPRWQQALGRYMMQFGNNFSQTDPFYLTNDR